MSCLYSNKGYDGILTVPVTGSPLLGIQVRTDAKPLLNVGDKPIVEHILDKINQIGAVDEIFIVTNHKFYPMFKRWVEEYAAKKKIKIVNDGTLSNEDRLGAIGDLNYVLKDENIDDDVLMIAGDNLFGFDPNKFLDFFQEKKKSILAFYDMKDKEKVANKFGVGLLDEGKRVTEFEEKPEEPRSTLAATCCYIYVKEDVQKVGDFVRTSDKYDNPGDFVKWLRERSGLYGFVFEEHWFDIGSFEGLEEANKFYGGNS